MCGIFHFRFRFKLQSGICVNLGSPKPDLETNFLNLENRSFENVSSGSASDMNQQSINPGNV